MSGILEELDKIGCEYSERFPMNRYTTMRVGGEANLLVSPKNHAELAQVLTMFSQLKVPRLVLGAGSNTIIDDAGLNGGVVSTKRIRDFTILEDGTLIAEAGAIMGSILNKTIKLGLTGFEFAAGIPGTVGGGIFMNAGANGGEIKDVVENVWVWLDGKEIVFSREELKFEYRKSFLPKGSVVTKASFRLKPGNVKEIAKRVKEYLQKRSRTQPITMSNSGSIFKNPPEIAAGKLLEELGLKGYTIGGAKFSELHANFIVNSLNAKASDIISLIETAKKEALSARGVRLETEVKIIGKEIN